ncbi:MAG: RnfH family protein [Luminiphilus sp.]|jgi:putative ubiquitin-RnfH superfamily antitoxin RatB of RatAB toxin-antitoxin module
MSEKIPVEVAYALPEKQRIIKLEVPIGTTASEAVMQSGIETAFDDLVLGPDLKLGVWGKATPGDRILEAGERVEIYRPLKIDPKAVRKARAAKAKAARTAEDHASEGLASISAAVSDSD